MGERFSFSVADWIERLVTIMVGQTDDNHMISVVMEHAMNTSVANEMALQSCAVVHEGYGEGVTVDASENGYFATNLIRSLRKVVHVVPKFDLVAQFETRGANWSSRAEALDDALNMFSGLLSTDRAWQFEPMDVHNDFVGSVPGNRAAWLDLKHPGNMNVILRTPALTAQRFRNLVGLDNTHEGFAIYAMALTQVDAMRCFVDDPGEIYSLLEGEGGDGTVVGYNGINILLNISGHEQYCPKDLYVSACQASKDAVPGWAAAA